MQCPNGYTMSVDGVCQPVGGYSMGGGIPSSPTRFGRRNSIQSRPGSVANYDRKPFAQAVADSGMEIRQPCMDSCEHIYENQTNCSMQSSCHSSGGCTCTEYTYQNIISFNQEFFEDCMASVGCDTEPEGGWTMECGWAGQGCASEAWGDWSGSYCHCYWSGQSWYQCYAHCMNWGGSGHRFMGESQGTGRGGRKGGHIRRRRR